MSLDNSFLAQVVKCFLRVFHQVRIRQETERQHRHALATLDSCDMRLICASMRREPRMMQRDVWVSGDGEAAMKTGHFIRDIAYPQGLVGVVMAQSVHQGSPMSVEAVYDLSSFSRMFSPIDRMSSTYCWQMGKFTLRSL